MRSARVEADKLYPLGLSGTISETGVLTTQFIHIAGGQSNLLKRGSLRLVERCLLPERVKLPEPQCPLYINYRSASDAHHTSEFMKRILFFSSFWFWNITMAYKDLLETLRTHSPSPDASMEKVREDFEAFYSSFQTDVTATMEASPLSSELPAFWIRHADIKGQHCMLFLHGGGFTIGSTRDHVGLCSRLSQAAETGVFSVDYRLAPEHRFPAALEDALLAYRALLAQYEPHDIIIAGISAGGGLALSLLLAMREQVIPLPAAVIALSPAVDLMFGGESVIRNADNDWISAARLANLRKQYLGEHDARDPLASPVYGDLSGLPPILIQAGTHELLLDDIRVFVDRLKAQEGTVAYQEWDSMFHCWHVFASEITEGQ